MTETLNMIPVRIAIVALAALCLSACGTTSCEKDEPFLATAEGEPLRVPDGLEVPRGSGKFDIPEAGQDKPVRGPCGDLPPLRKVVSAQAQAPAPKPELPAGPAAAAAAAPTIDLPAPPTISSNADPAADPALAAASVPPSTGGGLESQVRELVISWTSAWREADSDALIGFYSDEFEPPVAGESRDAWANKRAVLLAQSGPADVRFDRLTVSETIDGANARFIQEFHNGGQINALVKELDLKREEGAWKIVRERVVEVL